jgi:site-specific DNA recombinase
MGKPSRMDGYIRVSRVAGRAGESFISPKVQREQIEGWAKLRGVEIAAWHEDLDQSGGKLHRPGLDAMLARIESGDTSGVVVAKLDRLSRLGVADALKLVERITDAGGSIAAVDLGLDPTTTFGEFGMTIMLAMARMERRRLSDSWGTAKARAMDRGAKIGPTPLGYLRNDDGTLAAHPKDGPIITEAYRRGAQGGLQAARAYLTDKVPARDWTTFTTRRLLGTRTYLGESHYGEVVKRDSHPALTNRATWEAAQSTKTKTRRASAAFPLSGIATCATCGGRMVGNRAGAEQRTYRCAASLSRHKGEACTAGANTLAGPLEEYVRGALREAWSSEGWKIGGESADMAGVERALDEAEAELQAFGDDLTARRLFGARYHDHLQTRHAAVEAAQAAYRAEASKQARSTRVLPVELLDTEDPAELRELFTAALTAVIVTKGRSAIAGRVRLLPHGADRLLGVPAAQDPDRRLVKAS